MQTPAAPASCCVGCTGLFSFRVSYLCRFQVRRQASSPYSSIVVNDRVLPYPSLGKVEAKHAVKLKPLFVVLSVLGFHQYGWLLSDKLWEQSCGCQEKARYTLYTHYTDSERCLAENIKSDIVCFFYCFVLLLLNSQWLPNWLGKCSWVKWMSNVLCCFLNHHQGVLEQGTPAAQ